MNFGSPHRHLRSCESTNSIARRLAEAGAPGGTVVTADRQTAGRGRQGREWITAAPGAMLPYSAIHRDGAISPLLSLAVGVAVCEAIGAVAPVEPRVKWPNDVLIGGRKCVGILVEGRPQQGWAVIGIGINLALAPDDFPSELRDRATSVGHGVSPGEARVALNCALGRWVGAPDDEVLGAFERVDTLRGRGVSWDRGTGVAEGVDTEGRLVIAGADGKIARLAAGEVHLSPNPPPDQ